VTTNKQGDTVSQLANRLIELRQQLEIDTITVRRIETALDTLNSLDRLIIQGHYFEFATWDSVADNVHMSSSRCRARADEAVKKVAVALYGSRAIDNKRKGSH